MSGQVTSALTSGTCAYTSIYRRITSMIAEKKTWNAQNIPSCPAVPLSPEETAITLMASPT